jgi:hypothetical protein
LHDSLLFSLKRRTVFNLALCGTIALQMRSMLRHVPEACP